MYILVSRWHVNIFIWKLKSKVFSYKANLDLLKYFPVQFSHSVMSDSATPWSAACQASLSITSSQSLLKLLSIELVMPTNHLILWHPLYLLLQSFAASGSFPMNHLCASGGQSIGVSASSTVLPMNIQLIFLGWMSWISLQFKWLSRVSSNTAVKKHQFFSAQLFLEYNSDMHT